MAVGVWGLPDSLIREVGSIVKMLNPEVIRQSSCFHLVIVHFRCRRSGIVMVKMD